MAFWSKRPSELTTEENNQENNPFRQLDPDLFDKGANINRVAAELRRVANELEGSDVLAALHGAEIAAMTSQRNPNVPPDTQQYILDQMLDAIYPGVREAAYFEVNLPEPQDYPDDRDLSEDEFAELTNRIVNAATKHNVPVSDSVSATAKALGVIISILSERPGISADQLIEFSQKAVATFAEQAMAFRQKS